MNQNFLKCLPDSISINFVDNLSTEANQIVSIKCIIFNS